MLMHGFNNTKQILLGFGVRTLWICCSITIKMVLWQLSSGLICVFVVVCISTQSTVYLQTIFILICWDPDGGKVIYKCTDRIV